jgi:hypothetical protein
MAESITYQPTQNDWDLVLGCPGNDVHRALTSSSDQDFSVHEASDFAPAYTKKSATTTQIKITNAFGLPQAQSLDSLRHVMLQTVDIDAIFGFLINFVRASQGYRNDTVDNSSKTIMGYVFDQTRFGEYKMQLFEHQNAVGVSCRLTDGFAPTLEPFWTELVQALRNEGYVAPEPMESFEDDDFFFSDNEEMEDLDLASSSFLSLDQNPEVIESYVEDLKDPNFKLHTLTLLAWNLQNQKNFEAASKAYAQELFTNVVACLVSSATELTLPFVRAASILAAKLISEANVEVTKEQEAAIVQTIFSWTLNHASSTAVTRSEEIATVLTEQLGNFVRLSENSRGVLETIHKETDFAQVRYNIGSALHSIAVN